MAFRAAGRLNGVAPSEIARTSEIAGILKRQGRDVISLSTGESDFPTPDHVIEAAFRAARAGKTKYTPTAGAPELRENIAQAANRQPAEVVVTVGAKQAIFNAFLATLEPGDEVIMAAPYWTSYLDMIKVAGGKVVIVPCGPDKGYKMTPGDLDDAITDRTRWVLFNSPANPTGAVYSGEEIVALAKVLERHPSVWVLSDEIYDQLSFVPFASFADFAPGLRDRTLIVNGVSKSWSMTGWRVGWGIGPEPMIRAMIAVQGQATSGTCTISQFAALEALTGDQTLLAERRQSFMERRNKVVGWLNAIDGIECDTPDGAFFAFPSCKALLGLGKGRPSDDVELCRHLLDDVGVAIVSGTSFGMPGFLRLSFAYSEESLSQGVARIGEFVKRLTA